MTYNYKNEYEIKSISQASTYLFYNFSHKLVIFYIDIKRNYALKVVWKDRSEYSKRGLLWIGGEWRDEQLPLLLLHDEFPVSL